jgi:RNA recognition motif-containing protein
MMNIYVGNLPYNITDDELRDVFAEHGSVDRASVIKDKFSGQSKGFGFVEMGDNGEATRAIEAVNGANVGGRQLRVNEARPRTDRPRR